MKVEVTVNNVAHVFADFPGTYYPFFPEILQAIFSSFMETTVENSSLKNN